MLRIQQLNHEIAAEAEFQRREMTKRLTARIAARIEEIDFELVKTRARLKKLHKYRAELVQALADSASADPQLIRSAEKSVDP